MNIFERYLIEQEYNFVFNSRLNCGINLVTHDIDVKGILDRLHRGDIYFDDGSCWFEDSNNEIQHVMFVYCTDEYDSFDHLAECIKYIVYGDDIPSKCCVYINYKYIPAYDDGELLRLARGLEIWDKSWDLSKVIALNNSCDGRFLGRYY